MYKIDKNAKFNDEEMAKYAAFFNKLCCENHVTAFWWDTNLLINRTKLTCFEKPVQAIMECYPESDCVKETAGFEEESAEAAVRKMKAGWNLGNTFDANKYHCRWNEEKQLWEEELLLTGMETETCWFMPETTKELIHYLKTLGFNAVRIPVTWAGHLDKNNQIDERWLKRVKQVVDFVISEGMYCILNVHHDGGANGWVKGCESSFRQFSSRLEAIYFQLGKTFSDYDERLLFGGVNEMLDENSSWANPTQNCSAWVNKWNQLFVDTIRKTGGNNAVRNLVVMAPGGKGSEKALKQFSMPEDSTENHLIFEFHNYDPQCFCWPKNPANPNTEETAFWDEQKHGDYLKAKFNECMKTAVTFGVPVICGEYGAWPKVTG